MILQRVTRPTSEKVEELKMILAYLHRHQLFKEGDLSMVQIIEKIAEHEFIITKSSARTFFGVCGLDRYVGNIMMLTHSGFSTLVEQLNIAESVSLSTVDGRPIALVGSRLMISEFKPEFVRKRGDDIDVYSTALAEMVATSMVNFNVGNPALFRELRDLFMKPWFAKHHTGLVRAVISDSDKDLANYYSDPHYRDVTQAVIAALTKIEINGE